MKKIKLLLLLSLLSFAVSCGQQKKYVEYKVRKGETMRTIAKNLDLKTKDLLRLNPDVGRRPKMNTIIIVPNTKSIQKVNSQVKEIEKLYKETDSLASKVEKDAVFISNKALKKDFLVHEVKKGNTFYSLTRFYNVSQKALIALNPELSEGLKVGQSIKVKTIEENEEEVLIYNDEIKEGISLKVALLLPFKVSEFDTVSSNDIFDKSRLANYVTDFYLGAALAIDSLKAQGVSIELNVFDTERNRTKIRTILQENDLNENDVIIGPLYSEEAEIVANEIKKPIVFPVFSKNQSKFTSARIIKTSPEKDFFRDALVSYIKETYTQGTITVVSDGKNDSNFQAAKIKEILQAEDSITEVHILKPQKGYIEKDLFLAVLKPLTNNWVILATNDKVVVSDAINSLISLPDSTTAKVFALDKGIAFDRIDNAKLARLELTYVSDRFIDESSLSTKAFNKQYVAKNNTLPSFYATKGFDITYDILMRLASGDQLKTTFSNGSSYRVESKFNYSKKLFRTTENRGLFIVKYNKDLSLKRLK